LLEPDRDMPTRIYQSNQEDIDFGELGRSFLRLLKFRSDRFRVKRVTGQILRFGKPDSERKER
jgi:hypothetical protein